MLDMVGDFARELGLQPIAKMVLDEALFKWYHDHGFEAQPER